MWLVTRDGFYSIAQTRPNTTLTVRARDRESLERLLRRYDILIHKDTVIQEGTGTDYEFRVELPRNTVSIIAMDTVKSIDYPKFKPAAEATRGAKFYDVLVRAWAVLLDLNDKPGAQYYANVRDLRPSYLGDRLTWGDEKLPVKRRRSRKIGKGRRGN
jgi:hypothetical protein